MPRDINFTPLPASISNYIALFVMQPYTRMDGCNGVELLKMDFSVFSSGNFYVKFLGWMDDMVSKTSLIFQAATTSSGLGQIGAVGDNI